MKIYFGIAVLLMSAFAFPAIAQEKEESASSELPTAAKMNPEEIRYVAGLSRKIRKNWVKTEVEERKDLTISFVIDEDGEISDLTVLKSSGSEELDQQGLDAVKKSTPLEKPPESIKTPKKLRLNFVFQKKEESETKDSKEQTESQDD